MRPSSVTSTINQYIILSTPLPDIQFLWDCFVLAALVTHVHSRAGIASELTIDILISPQPTLFPQVLSFWKPAFTMEDTHSKHQAVKVKHSRVKHFVFSSKHRGRKFVWEPLIRLVGNLFSFVWLHRFFSYPFFIYAFMLKLQSLNLKLSGAAGNLELANIVATSLYRAQLCFPHHFVYFVYSAIN